MSQRASTLGLTTPTYPMCAPLTVQTSRAWAKMPPSGEDVVDGGLEVVESHVFAAAQPVGVACGACHPHGQTSALAVGSEWCFFGRFFLGIVEIYISEFIECDVGIAAVDVVSDGFQTTEEECLAQQAQVLAQRIEQADAVAGRIVGQGGVVAFGGQRVIQDLVPSRAGELFGNSATEVVGSVDGSFGRRKPSITSHGRRTSKRYVGTSRRRSSPPA